MNKQTEEVDKMKYRKKPVIIEAIQLKWSTWEEVCNFVPKPWFNRGVWVSNTSTSYSDCKKVGYNRIGLLIDTLEGQHLAIEDDYIIKGVNGEFYPCKPDIFLKTYDSIDKNG